MIIEGLQVCWQMIREGFWRSQHEPDLPTGLMRDLATGREVFFSEIPLGAIATVRDPKGFRGTRVRRVEPDKWIEVDGDRTWGEYPVGAAFLVAVENGEWLAHADGFVRGPVGVFPGFFKSWEVWEWRVHEWDRGGEPALFKTIDEAKAEAVRRLEAGTAA